MPNVELTSQFVLLRMDSFSPAKMKLVLYKFSNDQGSDF